MERFKTNATTTLNGSIDASQTSIIVASAAALIGSGTYRILVDSEIMTVTGVSSNTLTVTRGLSPAAHDSGAIVSQIFTAAGLIAHNSELSQSGLLADSPVQPVGGLYLPTDSWYSPTDGCEVHKMQLAIGVFNTWLNQLTSTVDESKGILTLNFNGASTTGATGYVKTTTGNQSATIGFRSSGQLALAHSAVGGLMWYRTTGTACLLANITRQSYTHYHKELIITSGTLTSSGTTLFSMYLITNALQWLRSSYNSLTGAIDFYHSLDGHNWTLVYSTTAAATLGGAPTHVGVGARRQLNGVGSMTIYHWEE